MTVDFGAVLAMSQRPLVLVGSAKNAGKTATLNRLRAEAQALGHTGFGRVSIGWDGEARDHLSGDEKPLVWAYEGDWVLSAGRLFTASNARFELLRAASSCGPLGRLAIGRCQRAGTIELCGPPTIAELGQWVEALSALGARRVLIDGAADRQTQLATLPQVDVGLAFVPEPREDEAAFLARILGVVTRYRLPQCPLALPRDVPGEDLALASGSEEAPRWRTLRLSQLGDEAQALHEALAVFVAGPLSAGTLQTLWQAGLRRVVVQDPSRLFAPQNAVARYLARGLRLEVANAPRLAFVSVRFLGPRQQQLAPEPTLGKLRAALPELPCFDPWLLEF